MTMQQTRTCDKCAGTITAEEIIRRRAGLVEGRLLCTSCVDELRRQVAAARAAQKARAAEAEAETAAAAAASAVAEREARVVEAAVVNEEATFAREAAAAVREEAIAVREESPPASGGNGTADLDATGFASEESGSAFEEMRAEERVGAAAGDERQALMSDSVEAEVEEQIEAHETLEVPGADEAQESHAAFESEEAPDSGSETVATEEVSGGLPRCLILHASPTEQGMLELQERLNEWLMSHPELSVKATSTTVGAFAGIPGEQRFIVTVFF